MSLALRLGQRLKREGEIMELVTTWEAFNTTRLAFCQIQGLLIIKIIAKIVVFNYNLGNILFIIIKMENII